MGEGCRRLSLAPTLHGNRRAHPGMHWDLQRWPRAMPGHAGSAGGCAAWGAVPHCRAQGGFPSTFPMGNPPPCGCTHHSLLHPRLLFPVKFRIVPLDKDFTPSNKKVRAGLGKGGGDRAPLHCPPLLQSRQAVRELWESASAFPLGNPAPASSAWCLCSPGAGMPCVVHTGFSRLRKEKAELHV